ncbi:hypothetical protein FALCPG4_008562 [Fusarium falciforme]
MKNFAFLLLAIAALAIAAARPSERHQPPVAPVSGLRAPFLPQLAQHARTNYVSVNRTKIAYRRVGKPTSVPLLFLTHFRGSMDVTDPLLINNIARSREVILVDNSGIGHSEGNVPDSIQDMAGTVVGFLAAINVRKVDILGFSLGGMVAQSIAMDHPQLVNRLLLGGVRPGYGPGVVESESDALSAPGGSPDSQPTLDYMLGAFFFPSNTSKTEGQKWWKRIFERQVKGEERKEFLVGPGVQAQVKAITAFASNPTMYERLADITMPVLVSNGKTDVLMVTANSFVLQQNLADAQLHLYPDSGHGYLFQFHTAYPKQIDRFLKD